jgi:hypothetical protein
METPPLRGVVMAIRKALQRSRSGQSLLVVAAWFRVEPH